MTAQSGRPPPPTPGAGAVASRSESPMRPNYVPEHVEPQIYSIASSPTSSIIDPPPLPPPASIAKATPKLPPTHTIPGPGSLPAGSRFPKQGQRADVQRMSKASSSSPSRLSAFVGSVGNALSSWMNRARSPSQTPPPLPHPPPRGPPPRGPPAQQTHPKSVPIYTPPYTDADVDMAPIEEEGERSSDLRPERQSSRFS